MITPFVYIFFFFALRMQTKWIRLGECKCQPSAQFSANWLFSEWDSINGYSFHHSRRSVFFLRSEPFSYRVENTYYIDLECPEYAFTILQSTFQHATHIGNINMFFFSGSAFFLFNFPFRCCCWHWCRFPCCRFLLFPLLSENTIRL